MGEKSEIRVKFEIGEIKFEAEGSADLVERERKLSNCTCFILSTKKEINFETLKKKSNEFY